MIVGHSNCGGAAACLGAAQTPSFKPEAPVSTIDVYPAEIDLNRWLEPLTLLTSELGLTDLDAVVEENVKLQVQNLSQSDVIQNVLKTGTSKAGKKVQIHGWVYDLASGRLKDLSLTQG